jgi:hypothetical protein
MLEIDDSQKTAFLSKVKKTKGCWEWTASTNSKGYGQFAVGYGKTRKVLRAHRISYELFVGEVPEGMSVLHYCDNPCCVRPKHLFLGTHADNMQDMSSKGRRMGVVNNRKLSINQVMEIRESSETGVVLASRYGVAESTISEARNRKTFKELL